MDRGGGHNDSGDAPLRLNLRPLLHADGGGLRAPWRIALFVVASTVCSILAAVVLGPVVAAVFRAVGLGVVEDDWSDVAGLLGGTAVALRWFDKRPWRDVWLDAGAARPTFLVQGFLIGGLAIALPILALAAVGWLRVDRGSAGSWGPAALRVSLFLLPAALAEELLTRGYIFSVLREVWGWRSTLVVTSGVFGLLHVRNAGATVESVALVTLAGVFLGGVLIATQSLYAAWMAHFAWNWMMAVVFHAAVSGYPLEAPGYRYVDAGPDWATGGRWGPEGGALAGIGMGAGAGVAYLFAQRSRVAMRRRERGT